MAIPTPITFGDDDQTQSDEKQYNFNHGKPIDLTPEAIAYVKSFMASNADKTQGKHFKIYVEGGGCSGMQYGFTFASKTDDDHVIACGDIEVLLDKASEQFIKGAVIDHVTNKLGSGFVVANPLAKGECGCGISFAV